MNEISEIPILSGDEFRMILNVFGYSQAEFANYANKTVPVIRHAVLKDIMPQRYVEDLQHLVGPETFEKHLRILRNQTLSRTNLTTIRNMLFSGDYDEMKVSDFVKFLTEKK